MVVLVALLIGVLAGAAVCAKYLRRELAANIAPHLQRIEDEYLRRIQIQLDTMQAEINLSSEIRLAALSKKIHRGQSDY